MHISLRLHLSHDDMRCLQSNHEYGARSFLSGKAAPNETVTVRFDPVYRTPIFTAVADITGFFQVQLDPCSEKTPFTVTIQGE